MSLRHVNLVDLVAADLPGYRRQSALQGAVRFDPEGGGMPLEVTQEVERRFLGRTTVARFHATYQRPAEECRLVIRHQGFRRRTGIEVFVVEGGASAAAIARKLEDDQDLIEAIVPLDFKRFELSSDGERWKTSVELVGASLVAIALPPIRSYVRLYPDQRSALISTFLNTFRVLGAPVPTDQQKPEALGPSSSGKGGVHGPAAGPGE
jgi:hypothetical protein